MCTSEGRSGLAESILRCTECGTTVSAKCQSTPEHKEMEEVKGERMGPRDFEAQLKATLLQAKNFPGMPADPNKLTLYFSPVFITADVLLGRKQRAALKDTDSLSACQVIKIGRAHV